MTNTIYKPTSEYEPKELWIRYAKHKEQECENAYYQIKRAVAQLDGASPADLDWVDTIIITSVTEQLRAFLEEALL